MDGVRQRLNMNADFVAPFYRWVEYLLLGTALQRRRVTFLPEVGAARRALICGDGDGRFTAALLQSNKRIEVDSVESSAAMLQLAERRVTRLGGAERSRVRFHHADARVFAASHDRYDLIATHFFLDCFSSDEAHALIKHLANYASNNCRWLVSDFRYLPNGLGRWTSRAIVRLLYACFRLTTGLRITSLPEYESEMMRCGFSLQKQETGLGRMLVSELWVRE